jgi:hypothetical protein
MVVFVLVRVGSVFGWQCVLLLRFPLHYVGMASWKGSHIVMHLAPIGTARGVRG